LIAAVAVAPMLAAYALYYSWRPTAFTNYGELITPTPIANIVVRQPDGSEFRLDAFKGKWVLLMVDAGSCNEFCRRKLYDMRQVRLTQGKDMDRIERAWLVDDNGQPTEAIIAQYAGTHIVAAQGSPLLSQLPAGGSIRDHIYVVDPLGNLMLRYPRGADPSRMKKDIIRLLKASRIG
jgi:cytochrome oxidase Cu insertion factor (SCO1/SenC/PrrC family)